MSEWQDISTAPRDGAEVDLWVSTKIASFRLVDCRWMVPKYGRAGDACWCAELPDETEPWRYYWQEIDADPTHWMPRPDPPQ